MPNNISQTSAIQAKIAEAESDKKKLEEEKKSERDQAAEARVGLEATASTLTTDLEALDHEISVLELELTEAIKQDKESAIGKHIDYGEQQQALYDEHAKAIGSFAENSEKAKYAKELLEQGKNFWQTETEYWQELKKTEEAKENQENLNNLYADLAGLMYRELQMAALFGIDVANLDERKNGETSRRELLDEIDSIKLEIDTKL